MTLSPELSAQLQALISNNIFFDHTMDAILILDDDSRILAANPSASLLLHIEPDALLNHRIWDFVPNLRPEDFLRQWHNLLTRGREEGTFTGVDVRGVLRTVEYRALGNILPGAHMLVLRDITIRKETQEKLRLTEELLQSILDFAPMPIYAVTPDQHMLFANRAWSKAIAPFRPNMHVDDLGGAVSPATLQRIKEINQKVLETGTPVEGEEQIDSENGSFTFYTVKFPLRSDSGKIEAAIGISLDVTDRIRAQQVLGESEKKFRSLVEQSNDGIIMVDENGIIIEWNHAQEQITGIPAVEAIGAYSWDLQFAAALPQHRTEQNYARLKENTLNMVRKGQSPWLDRLWETDLCRRNGQVVRIQSSTFLIQTERGYKTGTVTRDVSQERKIREEIDQRNKELTSLLGISQQISGQLDLDQLLSSVTQAVVQTLPGAEYALIWLYDEENHRLVVRACSGDLAEDMCGVSVPDSGNLVSRILYSDQPVLLNDVNLLANGLPNIHPLDRICALLGVPLVLDGKPAGVLTVCNLHRSGFFTEADNRWLQSLTGQVVVLAANARLFEQVSSGQTRLLALSRRLVEVQEEERRKIARELHDEVGQILTGLKLLLRMTGQGDAKDLDRNLREAQELTNDLLNRVHDMSLDLRPAMLDDLGLLPALLWQFDRFRHQTGIEVHMRHHRLEEVRFPAELETAAYRIIQEALTNVARHAGVTSVDVWIWANERELGLQVEDHGLGFDPQQVLDMGSSLGLNGIRERAALLGGQLTVTSTPGKGTRLRAVFPLS